jgi:hypothetical protein
MTGMRRKATAWTGIGCAALVLAGVAAVPVSADGAIGPDTCLDGYVWRDAVPGDRVCVTSTARDQAHRDNDLAGTRRSPTGGPYGPDTCLPGFVWRGAVPSDHVCVLPATWQQTHDDNLAADARRDALDLFVRTYFVHDPTCAQDETCQPATPYYRLRVERINVGTARVALCKRGGLDERGDPRTCRTGHDRLLRSWRVAVQPRAGGPGGVLRWWRSPIHRCPGPWNAYFRVRDPSSGRWSSSGHVTTLCTNL